MATSMQGHPTLVKFEASPQGHCTFRSPGSSGLQRRSALLRLTWLGSTQSHFEHIRKKGLLSLTWCIYSLWAGQRDAKETPVELCTRGQESLPQLCALKKAHDLHDNQGDKINKHVTFLIILDVCFMFLNVFWCFLTFVGCLLKGLKETHLSSRSSHGCILNSFNAFKGLELADGTTTLRHWTNELLWESLRKTTPGA